MRTQAIVLASAALALCPPVRAADDLGAVSQRGTLRVLVVKVSGPNEFYPLGPGKQGFDREIVEGFAALHGLRTLEVPFEGWDELVPALLKGRGDLIAGRFTVTEARRKQVAFTHEVFPTRNVVVTRKPTPPVESAAQLRTLRVGTVKGSSLHEAILASGVPAASIDTSIQPGTLPAALVSGRVAAVVMGVENAITAQRDDPALELGLFIGPPGSLAYAVHPEATALRAALDDYIDNLRRTPSWGRMIVKYFGESAPSILQRARAQ